MPHLKHIAESLSQSGDTLETAWKLIQEEFRRNLAGAHDTTVENRKWSRALKGFRAVEHNHWCKNEDRTQEMQFLPFVMRPQGLQVSKPSFVLCFVLSQVVLFLLSRKIGIVSLSKTYSGLDRRGHHCYQHTICIHLCSTLIEQSVASVSSCFVDKDFTWISKYKSCCSQSRSEIVFDKPRSLFFADNRISVL